MIQNLNVDTPTLIAAVVIGVLSVARTARLLTHDTFPPVAWVRERVYQALPEKWDDITECPFCQAPYLAAGMLAWAWVSDLHWTWWVINGWWGLSYIAAIIVAYDQPEG